MSHELLYTSVPKGLRPGAKGFCVVAMTAGMASTMSERLESLSGYRPAFPAGGAQANLNPVNFAHWQLTAGGNAVDVLSRVAFAGLDYSRRSNKFAHHIVVGPGEQGPAGPAWVMRQAGVMESQWSGEPRMIPLGRAVPRGLPPPGPCAAWRALTGDAGWAGVLAGAFVADDERPAYLVFAPGMDLLPLIDEAIGLLPAPLRWQVTFSTYFTDLPAGLKCAWRCCLAGNDRPSDARRFVNAGLVIDLTRSPGTAPDGPLVRAARTGIAASVASISSAVTAAADPAPYPVGGRLLFGGAGAVPVDGAGAPKRELGHGGAGTNGGGAEVVPRRRLAQAPAVAAEVSADQKSGVGAPLPRPLPRPTPDPAARRGRALYWAVALAWPLVALGGYAAYQMQHAKSNTAELTATNEGLGQQIKGLKAELVEAQKLNERRKDYDELKGQLEVARARKEAAESQRDDALKKADQSAALAASRDSSQKAEIQALQRSVAFLRQQLADAQKQAPARQSAVPGAAPAPAERPGSSTVPDEGMVVPDVLKPRGFSDDALTLTARPTTTQSRRGGEITPRE
jgi:hypothetical protein